MELRKFSPALPVVTVISQDLLLLLLDCRMLIFHGRCPSVGINLVESVVKLLLDLLLGHLSGPEMPSGNEPSNVLASTIAVS